MGLRDEANRRVIEFFERQIRGINDAVESSDNRVSFDLARSYIHEVRLAIRDMNSYEYLSATFLLNKIKNQIKNVSGFERPADKITGRFVFHDCIITINPTNPIDYFLAQIKCRIDDVAMLKHFRDNIEKL